MELDGSCKGPWLAALMLLMMGAGDLGAAPRNHAVVMGNYGRLPLRFEANRGQVDSRVKFVSRGAGYSLFLTGDEAVLALSKQAASRTDGSRTDGLRTDVVRMQLPGARTSVEPGGEAGLPGSSNYLMGDDAAGWHTQVPGYGRVRYAGIYPGVDLVYYGNHRQLEYDFVVAAGADAGPIQVHFDGARGLQLDGAGNLVIRAEDGEIAFHQPVVYQTIAGRRRTVAGRFALLGDKTAGFVIGRYDHARPLVIDPTLVYSTYLGGSTLDSITAIAVDASGAAYLTGATSSTDYPVTPGVLETTPNTAFVTKMNASGTALVYSTFLGGTASGSGANTSNAIAVDSAGDAYVVGATYATNFPVTTGALQTTNKAAASSPTGFVAKLNPTGTALVYSTYLGGTRTDGAESIVLDASNDAYVAGYAFSNDFPTTSGAIQTVDNSYASYGWNEYVTKLNPAGSALLSSTMLGGSGDYGSPAGIHVAVDSSGDAFVSSTVLSTDFPVTKGAYQTTNKATGRGNMTLAKVNPTATKLLYATYLGGTSSSYGDDVANGLAVDSAGNAYLGGVTYETNYPVTTGAFETTNKTGGGGVATGFVTKMNAAGSALAYSTYLGGSGQTRGDYVLGLALDSSGDVYVTGSTGSTDYPVTTGAYQTQNVAQDYGSVVFLTEMNPAGNGLLYSTYFGGANSFDDMGNAIALGGGGAVYLAGLTTASDFPVTTGVYQSVFKASDGGTGFVAEFTLGAAPTTIATTTNLLASLNPVVTGTKVIFTAFVTPNKGTGIPAGSVVFSIDQKAVATVALSSTGYASYTTATALALGQHAILASYGGSATYSSSGGGLTESITPATPKILPVGGVYPMAELVTIASPTTGTTVYYTTDGTAPTASSTKYTAPILVSTSEEILAVAVATGVPASPIAGANYKLISAPSALAVPQTAVTAAGATLNGLVSPLGLVGSYFFEYGAAANALTKSTPKVALAGGRLGAGLSFAPVPVSAVVTGLTTKTVYYYRVVMTTSAGTSSGEVLSFTTN